MRASIGRHPGPGEFSPTSESLECRRLSSGIGALRDSFTDEYQFHAPDRSTAQNYIEQLADDRHLDFGTFSNSTRGTPRNAGW